MTLICLNHIGEGRVGSDFLWAIAGRVGSTFRHVGAGPKIDARGQLWFHQKIMKFVSFQCASNLLARTNGDGGPYVKASVARVLCVNWGVGDSNGGQNYNPVPFGRTNSWTTSFTKHCRCHTQTITQVFNSIHLKTFIFFYSLETYYYIANFVFHGSKGSTPLTGCNFSHLYGTESSFLILKKVLRTLIIIIVIIIIIIMSII